MKFDRTKFGKREMLIAVALGILAFLMFFHGCTLEF